MEQGQLPSEATPQSRESLTSLPLQPSTEIEVTPSPEQTPVSPTQPINDQKLSESAANNNTSTVTPQQQEKQSTEIPSSNNAEDSSTTAVKEEPHNQEKRETNSVDAVGQSYIGMADGEPLTSILAAQDQLYLQTTFFALTH